MTLPLYQLGLTAPSSDVLVPFYHPKDPDLHSFPTPFSLASIKVFNESGFSCADTVNLFTIEIHSNNCLSLIYLN